MGEGGSVAAVGLGGSVGAGLLVSEWSVSVVVSVEAGVDEGGAVSVRVGLIVGTVVGVALITVYVVRHGLPRSVSTH